MHPTVPLFAAVLYIWVYYAVARSAMRQLLAIDPDYHSYLGARPGLGMSNSLAIGRMLFDSGVPKPFYPKSVIRKIALARYMLYLGPIVLIVDVMLFLHAG
jgi:hypothetical protein